MCRAYYSNCRGVSRTSNNLPLSCKEKVYIFDWKPCEKAYIGSVCQPTFHPDPGGDIGQCEDCEKIERKRNPRHRVERSTIYRVHCPSRELPDYAPPPYVAPPPYFKTSASSVPRPPSAARASTYLQLPPMSQFAESPYADGFQEGGRATEVSYTTAQQHIPFSSQSLHSSASNDSPNIDAIDPASSLRPPPTPTSLESPSVYTQGREIISANSEQQPIQTPIDPASLLQPPPMHPFLESPYVCTQARATSTNNEQQPIQNLPPVAQAFNCRRFNGYSSHEGESSLETRVLGLRSQLYENELQGPQKSAPWNIFSGLIRKAGEQMTGQGHSRQEARQPARSERLARQPRVKPQRGGMETWIALSSSLAYAE